MKIRTIIVDDEPLARERLRELLVKESDVEVVGECGDGTSAVAAIDRERPDLLFLDIQMPELDGFGVLKAIRPPKLPVVVFVTAYSQHALRAFEVHALDYLLKPFDRQRFRVALDRARQQVRHAANGGLDEKLAALLAEIRSEAKAPERIAVKTGGKVVFVKVNDIDWVEAADNYVNLHVGVVSHLLRETMAAIEKRLDTKQFLRISRSAIVNLERVQELQPMFHGDYAVILKDGTRLSLSRGHKDKLRQLLGH